MDARAVIASIPSSFFHYCESSDDIKQNGLNKPDFVELVLNLASATSTDSKKKHSTAKQPNLQDGTFAADLCLLFDQVDVNNDGILQWNEITGFLAEKSSQVDYIEVTQDKFQFEKTIDLCRGCGIRISCFCWIEKVSRVMLGCGPYLCCFRIESDKPKLDYIFSLMTLKKVSEIDLADKSRIGFNLEILNIVFVNELRLLYIVTNSSSCLVFRVSYREGMQSDIMFYISKFPLENRPTGAAICSATASSTTGEVSTIRSSFFDSNTTSGQTQSDSVAPSELIDREDCFRIYFRTSGSLVITCQDASLKGHTVYMSNPMSLIYHKDIVEDICIAPVTTPSRFVVFLVSCSLDGKVAVWDQTTLCVCCVKRGLFGGGKKLLFDESKGLILCSDFCFRILVWDMKDDSESPLLVLSGSEFLITDMAISSSYMRLASIDCEGYVSWWNWDYMVPTDNESRFLDRFQVSTEKGSKLVILEGIPFTSGCLHEIKVLVSGKKLHCFQCIDKREQETCVSDCLFNPTSLSLLSVHGSLVKIWNCDNARQKQQIEFQEPSSSLRGPISSTSMITAAELDARGRKMYAGFSSGSLASYNIMNGKIVKSFEGNEAMRQGVTVLCTIHEDDIVICGYEMGDVIMFDDSFSNISDTRIRSLCPAHQNSCILALCANKKHDILLSSSLDGSLRIWSLTYFDLHDVFLQQKSFSCIVYLDDVSLIIAGDESGGIAFFHYNLETRHAALANTVQVPNGGSSIIKLEIVRGDTNFIQLVVASKNGLIFMFSITEIVPTQDQPAGNRIDIRSCRGTKNGENLVGKFCRASHKIESAPQISITQTMSFVAHVQLSNMRLIQSKFIGGGVLLTCGAGDDKVCIWDLEGHHLGILTEGRLVDTAVKKHWTFPIVPEKVSALRQSLSLAIMNEIATKRQEEEEKARAQTRHMRFVVSDSLDEEYAVTIPSLPPTRSSGLVVDDYDPDALVFEGSVCNGERGNIFDQFQGIDNWKHSKREMAVMSASKSQQQSFSRSRSFTENQQYANDDDSLILQFTKEMRDNDSGSVTEKATTKSRRNDVGSKVLREMNSIDKDNWDTGSENRTKQDYQNFFEINNESVITLKFAIDCVQKKKNTTMENLMEALREEGFESDKKPRKKQKKKPMTGSIFPPIHTINQQKRSGVMKRPDTQDSAIMWDQTMNDKRLRRVDHPNSLKKANVSIERKLLWLLKQDNDRLDTIITDEEDDVRLKKVDIDQIIDMYQSASNLSIEAMSSKDKIRKRRKKKLSIF